MEALHGLRLRTPRLELRLGLREELLDLGRLAERGIHPPDEMPCRARSAAIAANAVPIITLRPSPRLAAATVSQTAAIVAAPALKLTKSACAMPLHITFSCERKCMSAGGTTAKVMPAASAGSRVSCRSIAGRIVAGVRLLVVPRLGDATWMPE